MWNCTQTIRPWYQVSQTPQRAMVSPGLCQCKDYPQAPEHLGCHRLAVGFARKVKELLAAEAPQEPKLCDSQSLPEAPASLNFKAMLQGYEVQVTLRDTDETRLLARIEALLKA